MTKRPSLFSRLFPRRHREPGLPMTVNTAARPQVSPDLARRLLRFNIATTTRTGLR